MTEEKIQHPKNVPSHLVSKGVSQKNYEALLEARELIANECVKHDDGGDGWREKTGFNMNKTCTTHSCGTVACIGGWMGLSLYGANDLISAGMKPTHNQIRRTRDFVEDGGDRGEFYDLFYPPSSLYYDHIENSEAVKAIDNFIQTGHPDWEKVCGR